MSGGILQPSQLFASHLPSWVCPSPILKGCYFLLRCPRWLVQAICYICICFAWWCHGGRCWKLSQHSAPTPRNVCLSTCLSSRLTHWSLCFHNYVYLPAVNKCSFMKQRRNRSALHFPHHDDTRAQPSSCSTIILRWE